MAACFAGGGFMRLPKRRMGLLVGNVGGEALPECATMARLPKWRNAGRRGFACKKRRRGMDGAGLKKRLEGRDEEGGAARGRAGGRRT